MQNMLCLWLCEKQPSAACSNFIGCVSGSGKPRARAVILASEGKKIGKNVWSHNFVGGETFLGYSLHNKVGIISESLVYHLRTCFCRSEIGARDRTPPGDSQNNFQGKNEAVRVGYLY